MKLQINTHLDYEFGQPTDVLLQLEAAIIPEQRVEHAHIGLPPVDYFIRVPGHDMIGDRIWLRVEGRLQVEYEATVAIERLVADIATLPALPPHELPAETVEYLMPSRFCPSDQMQAMVDADFGELEGGARIAAIGDWIGEHIVYTPGSSNASTTAMQTYVERQGVCRDFAHLLITMARASAIPARFASVYGLGVEPMDFHAVAEVFLDGAWHIVDATGMSGPDAIAKIGVGRDAADVSFLTSYGPAVMNSQTVAVSRC